MAAPHDTVDVKEPTRALLRRATQEFHEENPYVPMESKGVVYRPPESRMKQDGKFEKDDDSDDDDSTAPSTSPAPAGGYPAGEAAKATPTPVNETPKEKDFSMVWHVKIVADDFRSPKHTLANGDLKPRRPQPQIKASHLIKGLVKNDAGSYFFPENINGWPSMHGFMLVSITKATAGWGGLSTSIARLWTAKEGKAGKALPDVSALGKGCRATFWAPTWMKVGYSMQSPGFVFWYSEMHGEAARLLHGSSMLSTLRQDAHGSSSITNMHVYVHRYPVAQESMADRQTYHGLIMLEWEHGQFVTVAELAFLHGTGGYGGKSNWCEDKLAPRTKLLELMEQTPGFIQPWNESMSEIRMYDVACKNVTEYEAFLTKYSDKAGVPLGEMRFLAWECHARGALKFRYCNAEMLGGFLLNYIQRVWGYRQLSYNCQTFAADLYAFLTGDRTHTVYSNILKPNYAQHVFSFLYEPTAGKSYEEVVDPNKQKAIGGSV